MQTYLPSIQARIKPHEMELTLKTAPTYPGHPSHVTQRRPISYKHKTTCSARTSDAGHLTGWRHPRSCLLAYLLPPGTKAGTVSLISEPHPLATYILQGSTNQSYIYCHFINIKRTPSATWASKAKAVTPPACFRQKATLTFGAQLWEVTCNTELLKGWVPQLTAPEVTELLEFSKFSYLTQISAEGDDPESCSKKRNVENLKRDRKHCLSGQLACWILSYCLRNNWLFVCLKPIFLLVVAVV